MVCRPSGTVSARAARARSVASPRGASPLSGSADGGFADLGFFRRAASPIVKCSAAASPIDEVSV